MCGWLGGYSENWNKVGCGCVCVWGVYVCVLEGKSCGECVDHVIFALLATTCINNIAIRMSIISEYVWVVGWV